MGLENIRPKRASSTRKVSSFLLGKVFFRSFFIQAVRNSERLLGFGLAYTMLPVIRYFYKDKEKRKSIIQEYLTCFNTHPYLAAPIIGILIAEEEKNTAANESSREKIRNLKIQIMGPMGALGDTLFWATLRPFAALLGVSFIFMFWDTNKFMALTVGLLSFFCFYNFFHITVRFLGILGGYRLGTQIINIAKKINLQRFIRTLNTSGMIIIGIGLVFFSFSCSLFNLGEILNLSNISNFFTTLVLFGIINLLLLKVTPAKIILVLIIFGELLALL